MKKLYVIQVQVEVVSMVKEKPIRTLLTVKSEHMLGNKELSRIKAFDSKETNNF